MTEYAYASEGEQAFDFLCNQCLAKVIEFHCDSFFLYHIISDNFYNF
jgi:hypothetical protein